MPKVAKKKHSSFYTPPIKEIIISVLKKTNRESQKKTTLVSLDKPYQRTADYFNVNVRTLKKWETEMTGDATDQKKVSVAVVIIIIVQANLLKEQVSLNHLLDLTEALLLCVLCVNY